jgi:dihydropteroate synthase
VPLVLWGLGAGRQRPLAAGIRRERLVLDPGFGFGKTFESNYPLLARLYELRSLGQPLLAGVSRKAFLGRTLARRLANPEGGAGDGVLPDVPVEARANATVAAVAIAVINGADLVRVHDVAPAVEAAAIADAVLAAA